MVQVTPPGASGSSPAEFIGEAVAGFRRLQDSMTLRGGALMAAAGFVAAKGPALLIALGVSAAVSNEGASDVAAVLTAVGGLMVFVGRVRLGDLR